MMICRYFCYHFCYSGGIGTVTLILIITGSVVLVLIIVLLIVFLVMRSRRNSRGHERMHDPESRARNRPPSAADVNATPHKTPAQPLVGPVKPPSYTEQSSGYDNQASEDGDVSTSLSNRYC